MSGLNIQMDTRQTFVPEHGAHHVAFLVSDFYGDLEFKNLYCEFQYTMVDAEGEYPLPCGMCYEGHDMPFDVPLLFNGKEPYILTPEQILKRKSHKEDEQRFWWIKTWFLSDGRMMQIHPEELDELSIGIMKQSDFIKQVRVANVTHLEVKNVNR